MLSNPRLKIISASACGAIGVVGLLLGWRLPFADQWPVFDGLRQTSAIVFGLSGAIIAIVYPEALKSFLPPGKPRSKEADIFYGLIDGMELSFAVLVVILLVGFFAPAVKHIAAFAAHPYIMRSLSFCFAGMLTVVELLSIVCIIIPLAKFTTEVDRDQGTKRITKAMLPLSQRQASGEDDDNASDTD